MNNNQIENIKSCGDCPAYESCEAKYIPAQRKGCLKYLMRDQKEGVRMSNREYSVLTQEIPSALIKPIWDLLKEVYPRHIDEVAFFNSKNKLLIDVFPAIESLSYQAEFDHDKEWLKKSEILVKRTFKISEISYLKVYSEEVHFKREMKIEEV